MKICPECGRLISYNSYFGAYICENCKWEDASNSKRRATCCVDRPSKFFSQKKMPQNLIRLRKLSISGYPTNEHVSVKYLK